MSCDCNTLVVGEAGPQGPQGLAGTNGTNGTNGINAFTTLTTQFTQPSVSGSETIVVGNNQWIATGQVIYISGAGFYTATSFSGTTGVVCTLEQTAGISSGNPVSSGRKISPSSVATYAAPLSGLQVNGDSDLDGNVVINQAGADKDLRVQGDTDINLLQTDASADRVGVGIAAPETKFHVAGSFKVGTLASGADSIFTRAATFNNNQDPTGDFTVKSQNFSSALFVDASTDRVGIGTNTPDKLLDVAGAMETNTILVNPGGVSGTEVLKVLGTSSAVPLVVNATNNRVGIKTASPSVELDVTGAAKISGNLAVDTNVLFVDTSTNRVGINDATPSYSLDVTGDANITSTLDVGGVSTLASASITGSLSVGTDLSVDTNVLFAGATNNFVGINTSSYISDAALIVSGGDLIVGSTDLFVDASLNRVGVNTNTPGAALDVVGTAKVSGNFSVDTDVLFVNTSTNKVGINTVTPTTDLDITGTVNINGALQRKAPVTKTTDFIVGTDENWLIVDNNSGTTTVTLPTASSWTGREIMLKTIQAQAVNSASSNVVPLAGGAAGTSILTGTAGKFATLVSDGANWIIMAGN